MKMKFLRNNLLKLTLIVFLLSLPIVSFANGTTCEPGRICNPINETDINSFIKTILNGVLRLGMPIVAVAIIYCGFLFVKAQGKAEEIQKAKDALMYTLIGAAILLGSWTIAQIISNTVLAL